ncbi:MAG: hypothetical protein WC197_05520, partial [Candidatus Gastranaerophilaceae bacterium]
MTARKEYAQLSKSIYDKTSLPANWTQVKVDSNSKNGFQGTIYQNAKTGEYVVAYASSSNPQYWLYENFNNVMYETIPDQYYDAWSLYNKALDLAEEDSSKITVTGHSLGGVLSQLIGAETGSQAWSFNSAGGKNLLNYAGIDEKPEYPNIHNISLANDPLNFASIGSDLEFIGDRKIIQNNGKKIVDAHNDFDALGNDEAQSETYWNKSNKWVDSAVKALIADVKNTDLYSFLDFVNRIMTDDTINKKDLTVRVDNGKNVIGTASKEDTDKIIQHLKNGDNQINIISVKTNSELNSKQMNELIRSDLARIVQRDDELINGGDRRNQELKRKNEQNAINLTPPAFNNLSIENENAKKVIDFVQNYAQKNGEEQAAKDIQRGLNILNKGKKDSSIEAKRPLKKDGFLGEK